MDAIDHMLNRRPIEFYIGKILRVGGSMTPPGYPPGYYIPLRINAQGGYDYHFIGTELPEAAQGEPIYIHEDGRRDLQAVASTVKPPRSHFLFWIAVYVVVAGFLTIVSADDMPIFAIIIWSPVLLIPFHEWLMNIEPVFATKVSAVILALVGAQAAKQAYERNHDRG